MHGVFSVAQLFGYCAFFFGVSCFLQKNDLRFKIFLVLESISYVLHFWLLGNFPAMASAGVATTRTLAAIRTRSPWAAFGFVALTLALGVWLVKGWAGALPIVGSCIGTIAVFLLRGIAMRCMLFVATLLWLTNNILSGSIGGTMLETCIGIANLYTIWRLWRSAALPQTASR